MKNFDFYVVGGLALCLFLVSCIPTAPVVKSTTAQPREKILFRSQDYVVYGLEGGETAEKLAERFLGDRKKAWIVAGANPDLPFNKGQVVVIPLKERNKGGLNAKGYQTVPVLAYHRFAENCKSALCMPLRVFDSQMKFLKENGYRAITPEDLLAFLEYRRALPKKSVWITMDDGYRSVYDIAYPILKKYGFTATLFVYTNFVGVSKTAITWKQLRELKAAGFAVGSHTISHADLTNQKDGESEPEFLARLKNELSGSKKIIDKKLDQNTCWLAYPYGNYDPRVMRLSREAGYKISVSVKRGGNSFFVNPYAIRRDQILKKDLETFASRLKNFTYLSLE